MRKTLRNLPAPLLRLSIRPPTAQGIPHISRDAPRILPLHSRVTPVESPQSICQTVLGDAPCVKVQSSAIFRTCLRQTGAKFAEDLIKSLSATQHACVLQTAPRPLASPPCGLESLFDAMWFLSSCGTTSEPCRNHAAVWQAKAL